MPRYRNLDNFALNPRQKKFAEIYAVKGNGTEAAKEAGYSEKSAKVTASKLLTNVNVLQAIEYMQGDLARRSNIDQDKVIFELARLGFSSMKNYITLLEGSSGGYIDLSALTDDDWAAIKKFECELISVRHDDGDEEPITTRKMKIELYDKRGPLELLGRVVGLLSQRGDESPQSRPLDDATLINATERIAQLLNLARARRDRQLAIEGSADVDAERGEADRSISE